MRDSWSFIDSHRPYTLIFCVDSLNGKDGHSKKNPRMGAAEKECMCVCLWKSKEHMYARLIDASIDSSDT